MEVENAKLDEVLKLIRARTNVAAMCNYGDDGISIHLGHRGPGLTMGIAELNAGDAGEIATRVIEAARGGNQPTRFTSRAPDAPIITDAPAPIPCGIPLAGDIVEAIAKRVGMDRLAKFWERVTGKGCGCAGRKARLNRASQWLLRIAGLG